MFIEMITVGPFQSNCFLVGCERTREAIVIDAGDEPDRILGRIRRNALDVKMIVNTHAHLDHITGLPGVKQVLGVPVLMHEAEMVVYERVGQQAVMFGLEPPAVVDIDRYVSGGDKIEFGDLTGIVVDTPGHSPGGISIRFEDTPNPRVFVGDVLFQGSIGRTDLPGSNHATMLATLKNVVMRWPDAAIIYPGYGPETVMADEKRTNPFLLGL